MKAKPRYDPKSNHVICLSLPWRPTESKDPEIQIDESMSPSLTLCGAGHISLLTAPQDRETSHGRIYLPVIHSLGWLMYSLTSADTQAQNKEKVKRVKA